MRHTGNSVSERSEIQLFRESMPPNPRFWLPHRFHLARTGWWWQVRLNQLRDDCQWAQAENTSTLCKATHNLADDQYKQTVAFIAIQQITMSLATSLRTNREERSRLTDDAFVSPQFPLISAKSCSFENRQCISLMRFDLIEWYLARSSLSRPWLVLIINPHQFPTCSPEAL